LGPFLASKMANKNTKGAKVTDARRAYLKKQSKRSFKEQEEVKELEQTISTGAPPRGSNPLAIESKGAAAGSVSYAGARTFEELPLSAYTIEGLAKSNYVTLTAIQRAAIPHALCGRDILGASKTGSGKTLSFLIPVSVNGALPAGWRLQQSPW
jgi:ATP-dependent RNA helicase DDX10/DBP4